MSRTARQALASTAVAVLALGTLTACLPGGSDKAEDAATEQASLPESVATVLGDTHAAAGTGEPTPVEVTSELPVIATRTASTGDTPVTIALNSVSVSGGITTVMFSVTNDGPDSGLGLQVSDIFSDGESTIPLNSDGAQGDGGTLQNTDGVTLLDAANKKIYRVAYDNAGGCLCSSTSGIFIDAGHTTVFQASFAALPKETSAVTVTIPVAGAFENVPVTR
ncbi:hypothetical protein ACSL103130_07225 [Actinomyces slackii]|uniref:DUF11 domain-containing protein n=1 Tax=Actinomyces slackii TaxID=52774 RepID=A0A3S4WIW7_9ACTO|nr:hypothetical protein [Actinomyces slackii]VEG75993.1 Uncharacterised protein [Actinomyces slackii]